MLHSLVFGLKAERVKKVKRKEMSSKEELKLNKESEEAISKVDALLSNLNVHFAQGKQIKPIKQVYKEEIKKIKEKEEEKNQKKP